MALSPNYSWAEPDNSSLVKNGAADIRTLGDAIDTAVWNVGYGQAAKNKVINGDFSINQRNFTSVTTTGTFMFDRFLTLLADGTVTYTPQVFTPGTAPVSGYEATNYLRCVTTGQTLTTAEARIITKMENVRTFAGQTVTVSFWAKAGSGTPSIALELIQTFGTSGSTSVTGIISTKQAITTGWARYTWTGTVPSIAGKTVGTANDCLQAVIWLSAGSSYNSRTDSLGIQSNTFDIWGVQAEYGSTATPFQTASGGSIADELAMCQRYYWRFTGGNGNFAAYGTGLAGSTTQCDVFVQFPTTMRIKPTTVEFATLALGDGNATAAVSTLTVLRSNELGATLAAGATGLTQYRPHQLLNNNNSTTAFLGVTAEL